MLCWHFNKTESLFQNRNINRYRYDLLNEINKSCCVYELQYKTPQHYSNVAFQGVDTSTTIREKGGCQQMQWHKHKEQPYFNSRPMNSQRKWQRKSQLSDFSPCQLQAEIQAEKSEKQRKSLCPKDVSWLQGFNFTPLGEVTWTKPGQTCWKDRGEKSIFVNFVKRASVLAQGFSPTLVCSTCWTWKPGNTLKTNMFHPSELLSLQRTVF